jgi:hypothetical protein
MIERFMVSFENSPTSSSIEKIENPKRALQSTFFKQRSSPTLWFATLRRGPDIQLQFVVIARSDLSAAAQRAKAEATKQSMDCFAMRSCSEPIEAAQTMRLNPR